ncbi:MAG: hypothetical protein LBB47_00790, partial [Spirochaetaceae bacterium]|nr:hypothetical protein [Spirochaetaceae bacterium]
MKKRSFVFGFAALLGAALIFAGCQQDAESGGTTYVTKTVGKVTQSVEGLQALLNDDDVTEVNYEDGDLVIENGTTLNIPAGKTLNVSSGGVKVGAAGVFAVVGTLNLQPNMTITVETGGILIGRKEGPDDLTNLLADPDTPVVGIYTSISGAAEAHESGGEAAVLDVSVAELNNSAFEGTLYVLGTITITGEAPNPAPDLKVTALGKIIFNVPSGATADISKLDDVGGALLKSATPIRVKLPANGNVGAIEAG